MVGNKSDLYEQEEIKIEEGMALAKELNAIFQLTSAKSGSGIKELFTNIGKRILDPNFETNSNMTKEELKKKGKKLKREKVKKDKKKKCC